MKNKGKLLGIVVLGLNLMFNIFSTIIGYVQPELFWHPDIGNLLWLACIILTIVVTVIVTLALKTPMSWMFNYLGVDGERMKSGKAFKLVCIIWVLLFLNLTICIVRRNQIPGSVLASGEIQVIQCLNASAVGMMVSFESLAYHVLALIHGRKQG